MANVLGLLCVVLTRGIAMTGECIICGTPFTSPYFRKCCSTECSKENARDLDRRRRPARWAQQKRTRIAEREARLFLGSKSLLQSQSKLSCDSYIPIIPPMEQQKPLLITVREAARILSICERTLYTLTKRGLVPAVIIGRSVRYDPKDLEKFIADSKTQKESSL